MLNSSYIKNIIVPNRISKYFCSNPRNNCKIDNRELLKFDLLKLEAEIIEYLYNSYEKDHYKFNNLVPVVVDSSDNLKVGETYVSNIMLAAYDTTRYPIVMVADISQPDSVLYFDKADNERLFNLEVDGQYCIYRKTTRRKGIHGYKGVIKIINAEGYQEKYFFEKTFNVTD